MTPETDHYGRALRYEQSQVRRLGRSRIVRYLENRRYYYGENLDPDNVEQPLHIRYVPRIVEKHNHYLWGEWERDIINWTVRPKDGEVDEQALEKITQCIYRLMRRSKANDCLPRGSLDGGIYGDSIYRVKYSPKAGGAVIENILPEYYHAIWHPLDITDTQEVVIAYNVDRQIAYQQFGTIGNNRFYNPQSLLDPGLATVWEWWSDYEYMTCVDDQIVKQEKNPYAPLSEEALPGWIPFVHIPNSGINGEYYGFGDSEAIHALQDELNMRLADLGDIVNYHAHPITLLRKFFGDKDELKTGPDGVWDLGREGEADYLEWKGTPPAVFDYLELVMRILFDTASLTPVAFGRTDQSQASSAALVVQMLPIVEFTRKKRAQWTPKLAELARKLVELEAYSMSAEQFAAKYGFPVELLASIEIHPKWAPILPRDRTQIINDNVALLVNKARSSVRTLEDLGEDDPQREYARILDELRDIAKIELAQTEEEAKIAMKYGVPVTASDPIPFKSSSSKVNRAGGKNSKSASGGSNTDGG